MKAPLLILFIAGGSLSLALRTVITHAVTNEERIVTLEDRVNTLERNIEACCSTTHGMYPEEQAAHGAYVELKKRVAELEKRIKELEGER
jgi:hypothetical protein